MVIHEDDVTRVLDNLDPPQCLGQAPDTYHLLSLVTTCHELSPLPHGQTLQLGVVLRRGLDHMEPVIPDLAAVQADLARHAHPRVLPEHNHTIPDNVTNLMFKFFALI